MATYLYCILPSAAGEPPTALAGVGGVPARALPFGRGHELQAWVATLDAAAFQVSGGGLGADALLHNEVVAAALATGYTPVPARFGSHFADDPACLAILATRVAPLRETLMRLGNTVEMSVLIAPARTTRGTESMTVPDGREAAAGRRYLELVRDRVRRMEAEEGAVNEIVSTIRDAVRDITRGEARGRQQRAGGTAAVVSIAYLLRRDDVARFRASLHALSVPARFRLIVAEPRAPYSFVDSNAILTGHDSGSPNGND